jgi:ribokinase
LILVFGSINADLSFALDQAPAPGQTVLADRLTTQPGGKGANQAVAARRDGASVVMVGAVGDDALSAIALVGLRGAGVDLTRVVSHAETATGCASIWTDRAGRNQIAVALGANARVTADQVDPALLTPATTVLLQMETDPGQVAIVIRRARAAGSRVILNLAPAILLEADAPRLVDLLVVNEDEAQTLADAFQCAPQATALHTALGVGVIRTLGADGAEAATSVGTFTVAAPRVTAVDTTAAGDCFVGVLAAALDRGLPLNAAMQRGCVAAALACTQPGSQRSLPDAASIDAACLAQPVT